MRAYQIQDSFGLEHLRLNEVAGIALGPRQVAVRVRAVSLNYRDLLVVKGLYSRKLPLPLTICSDGAGEVAETGPGVTRVKPGDRVAAIFMQGWISGEVNEAKARTALGAGGAGMLAERVVLHEEGLVHVPEHLSWEEAATLPCAGVTAWNALVTRGGLKAGDTVVVMGTGGVSIFALQLARIAGARVIATSSKEEKLRKLLELGALDVINYVQTPDWEEAVRKLTGGGADHIIEVGGAGTLAKSIRAVRMGGRISLIGNLAPGAEVNPLMATMKGVTIQGIFVGSREMFEAMNRAIVLHRMRPVVDTVFEFEQARDALSHMDAGKHFGKIAIRL